MIRRSGEVRIRMRADVGPKPIGPPIRPTVTPGATVDTGGYALDARPPAWGDPRRTVGPAAGEFARDDDRDGFRAAPVNKAEGFWSLLRSWLRPPRGISQERLPLYLGFFEFVHNVRKRPEAPLGSLVELLVAPRNPG
jgi:hypothetical protein